MPNNALKISTIEDSTVKHLAQNSNVETDTNDTIETEQEWKMFMYNIAEAFGSGKISYKVAKKYVDLSSSIFIENNDVNKAYKNGFVQRLESRKNAFPCRLFRMFNNSLSPNQSRNEILVSAESAKIQKEINILQNKDNKNDPDWLELTQLRILKGRIICDGYDAICDKYENHPKMGI